MNLVLIKAFAALQTITPMAGASDVTTKIVSTAATIAGGLIAAFLIYSIVKDAYAFAKGQGDGSVFKIIGKVLFLLLCIGLIVVAQNWANFKDTFGNIAEQGVNVITNTGKDVIGGGK